MFKYKYFELINSYKITYNDLILWAEKISLEFYGDSVRYKFDRLDTDGEYYHIGSIFVKYKELE